jgi:dUTP pyrophosphatase
LYIDSATQCIVPTGLAFSIPEGMELQLRPRSGLAAKKGITITNSPGTLDSDYTDELFVIIYNSGKETFVIKQGDRIAQCVLKQVERAEFNEVDDFDAETMKKDRGGGFCSTGNN